MVSTLRFSGDAAIEQLSVRLARHGVRLSPGHTRRVLREWRAALGAFSAPLPAEPVSYDEAMLDSVCAHLVAYVAAHDNTFSLAGVPAQLSLSAASCASLLVTLSQLLRSDAVHRCLGRCCASAREVIAALAGAKPGDDGRVPVAFVVLYRAHLVLSESAAVLRDGSVDGHQVDETGQGVGDAPMSECVRRAPVMEKAAAQIGGWLRQLLHPGLVAGR